MHNFHFELKLATLDNVVKTTLDRLARIAVHFKSDQTYCRHNIQCLQQLNTVVIQIFTQSFSLCIYFYPFCGISIFIADIVCWSAQLLLSLAGKPRVHYLWSSDKDPGEELMRTIRLFHNVPRDLPIDQVNVEPYVYTSNLPHCH